MQTSKHTFSFDVMHFVFEWALILNHWGWLLCRKQKKQASAARRRRADGIASRCFSELEQSSSVLRGGGGFIQQTVTYDYISPSTSHTSFARETQIRNDKK
jgi:hypothetical protein